MWEEESNEWFIAAMRGERRSSVSYANVVWEESNELFIAAMIGEKWSSVSYTNVVVWVGGVSHRVSSESFGTKRPK